MTFRSLLNFLKIFNRINDFGKDKYVNNAWAYSQQRPGRPRTSARCERTPVVVTANGGVATGDGSGDEERRSSRIELEEVKGRAPSNTNEAGAHQRGRSLARRWRQLQAAAF
jgi:hypothetical protein